MPVSVLIGNGFNRIDNNQPSWEAVLTEIACEVGHPEIVDLYEHKPETLIFEQLAFAGGKSNKEDEIKAKLATKLIKQSSNHLHKKAINSGFRHILTTNYDYNFEDSITGGSNEITKSGSRETKYSLFRRHRVNRTSIWHIHGEVQTPKTIMLGYEHYAGSLQNLRAYMTANRPSSKNAKVSQFKLGNYAFEEGSKDYSWIDIFLRDDIHIIGLSLGYTEADLWWAITYKHKLRFYQKYELGRTIYHYMPAPQNNDSQKLSAKLEVLRSLGVKTRAFDQQKGHDAWYAKALEQASNG